jgi:hypothetical protein
MDEKTIARFWSKVEKRGPHQCWEWRAYRMPNGYGQIGIGRTVFLAAGAKVVPLAKTYGVYYTTIIAIAKRKSWKHI